MLLKNQVLLFCCLLAGSMFGQQRKLDSLVQTERKYQHEDTIRAKLLTDIARMYYSTDPAKGLVYAEMAVALAEKLPAKKFLASAYSVKGANCLSIPNYPAALESYQKALATNELLNNIQGQGNNYNNIGLVYYSIFDYARALEYYLKTLTIYEKTGDKSGMANTLGNIGNIYNELRDYPNAIVYYERAIKFSDESGNLQSMAGNMVNLGNVYTNLPDLPKALQYKLKALEINKKLGKKALIANNLGNIGNVYTEMGDSEQALKYHQQALDIYQGIDDKKGVAANYSGIGDALFKQKKYAEAADFERKARDLAHQIGSLNTESEALESLSAIYEATNQFDSAYLNYQRYIVLKDSINNVEKQKEITRKSLTYEFKKTEELLKHQQQITDAKLKEQVLLAEQQQQQLIIKQNAVELANQDKAIQYLAYLKTKTELDSKQNQLTLAEKENVLQLSRVNLQETQLQLKDNQLRWQETQKLIFLAGFGLVGLLSFFIYRNFRNQKISNRIISVEKKKSDDLLLNILPGEVAAELKETGRAMAKKFDAVTVLFTDFVDFTRVSERLSAEELVNELHHCFQAFDEIMEKHGLEKIKTIGDAYMAVAGLPVVQPDHAHRAARAALDIQQFMQEKQRNDRNTFEIRIGMHSGPVVAGIVGVKKFAYDIWGDTVNTASRMESTSEPGKINLSGATYSLINGQFTCVHRGKVAAKNKGDVDMYFLG